MKTTYNMEIMIEKDDADALIQLFQDYSENCASEGIWSRASAKICGKADDADHVPIQIELSIDESLRNKPGAKPKTAGMTVEQMIELRNQGLTPEMIADRAGISRATFYRKILAYEKANVTREY